MIFFTMEKKHWLRGAAAATEASRMMRDADDHNDVENYIALIIVLAEAAAAGVSAITGKHFTGLQFLDAAVQMTVMKEAHDQKQRAEEELRLQEEQNETPIESPNPSPNPHVPQTDIGEDDGDEDEDPDSDDDDDSEKPEKLLC